MPVVRFPLVGAYVDRLVNAQSSDERDQHFINCFPDVWENPVTGKSSLWLTKREGSTSGADVDASAIGSFAGCMWTSNSADTSPVVFAFIKNSSAQFRDQNGTQIGSDVPSAGNVYFMSETLISGVANLTASVSNLQSDIELWFFPEGGAWTKNTDGDLPTNIRPVHCHMDGYQFFITKAGVVWNTDLNSLSAVTATSFLNAHSMPDGGRAVVRYRNFVVAFGDHSFEMFYNAGNATGSPLSRVDNSIRRIGVMRGQRTILTIGDTVYWIGRNADTGKFGVYRLNGSEAEKISNASVDRLLAEGGMDNIGGSFTMGGYSHVAFPAGDQKVLCYCIETKFWWWFQHASAGVNPSMFAGGSMINGTVYYIGSSSRKIWTVTPSSPVWIDGSVSYTMRAQTGYTNYGTYNRKFFKSLALIGDTQSSAANINVSYSDDDSAYNTAVSINMVATAPQSYRLRRLGVSRRRAWRFENSSATPLRLEAVEIDYDVGAS